MEEIRSKSRVFMQKRLKCQKKKSRKNRYDERKKFKAKQLYTRAILNNLSKSLREKLMKYQRYSSFDKDE